MGDVFGHWWMIPLSIAAAVGIAVAIVWTVVAVTLWIAKPDAVGLHDVMRLLPDVLRLIKRLASDPRLPRRIRWALIALLAFIASPIDLIPDVIPVIGFADDVIITALVLRWVTRTAGVHALIQYWPGTPDGLAALCRLCGVPNPE